MHRFLTPPCGSESPPSMYGEVCRFLSEADEQEVLGVLRMQFRHEQRITSDDVRFVVRAVASHGGAVFIPPDFPPVCWILEFKRAHGFSQLGSSVAFVLPERPDVGYGSCSSSIACVTASSVSSGGSSDDEKDRGKPSDRHYDTPRESTAYGRFGTRSAHDSGSPLHHSRLQQQQQRRSMVVDDHRAAAMWKQRDHDREELGSNSSRGSFDSENGTTTGASSSSSVGLAPPSTNNSSSCNHESSQETPLVSSEKRGYKLSHTVSSETWEKAITAVEQQGMSLRAAAKVYGVHFAALHRRVKKRAQGGQSTKGNNGYFHLSDEAGIMRVVVARAELGVLMTFDELMKLVETAALRKLPDISVENARKLLVRFQSRNEQSIRHIIVDWPPPLPAVSPGASTASHYYLEHPGYDYGSESSVAATFQRAFAAHGAGSTGGSATAAAMSSQFLPPANASVSRPVLPSMNIHKNLGWPSDSTLASSPMQSQHVSRDREAGHSRPVMFV